MENGSYKTIAHISEHGNIKYYVKNIYEIPGDALLKIEHQADVLFHKWDNDFSSLPPLKQYEFLLDHCTTSELLTIGHNKSLTIDEKIQILKTAYMKRH